MLVAVYGTLKQSESANGLMQFDAGGHFIGSGTTLDNFRMTETGFPRIAHDENGFPVRVEVYDVPEAGLDVLDGYEGVPYLYRRGKASIAMDDGDTVVACIYIANELSGIEVPTVSVGGKPAYDWTSYITERGVA